MANDICTERPLFGAAISCSFPARFQDVSNIRQVPDHQVHFLSNSQFDQYIVVPDGNATAKPFNVFEFGTTALQFIYKLEVFVDPTRDESLIVELLDLKKEVADHESATWFLHDLAIEQDASDNMVLEHSGTMELPGLQYGNVPVPAMTAVGQLAVSKGRQGRGAENIVRVYLANIRLKNVSTDVLITAYEPLLINPLSESARAVGAGVAVPAEQSGCLPVQEVFRLAISSFKIHDWNLFGGSSEA